jgi:hypothetical protein
MTHGDIANLIMTLMVLGILAGLYFGTLRPWYVRFDQFGDGHYTSEPVLIMSHTFEGAKRKAKRMCRKNNWDGFKLRKY